MLHSFTADEDIPVLLPVVPMTMPVAPIRRPVVPIRIPIPIRISEPESEATTMPPMTMESTAVEITIAAEFVAAAESSAMEVTPTTKIAEPVTIPECAVVVAAEITIAGSVIAAVEAVEPRTRADKNAAIEVCWPVVAVGCAGVWVISVVAVGAVGRRTDVSRRRNIARTNSNAYAKSHLGIGRARENYQQPE